MDLPPQGYLPVLHRTICAAFLTMLDYEDGAVDAWVQHRLDRVYDFARRPISSMCTSLRTPSRDIRRHSDGPLG